MRELFLIGIGAGLIADILRGNPALILFPIGIIFLILGFAPVKFIPPEAKLLHFLQYKKRSKKSTKKTTSLTPESAGIGTIHEETEDEQIINDLPLTVKIDNLDSPYTLSLKTGIKKQFIPVTITINKRIIANTVTNRHGDVTCTIMIDEYGPKDVRVISDAKNEKIFDGLKIADGNFILYDRRIIFENN